MPLEVTGYIREIEVYPAANIGMGITPIPISTRRD